MSQINPAAAALSPSALVSINAPGARPPIHDRPVPYHDAGSVPPTGPPGFEGEWNPIDGGTPPGSTTPPSATVPPGITPIADKLRLMLAIANALGPAVTDGGMAGQVDAQSLADALRGLANLLDPPSVHGPLPMPHGPIAYDAIEPGVDSRPMWVENRRRGAARRNG